MDDLYIDSRDPRLKDIDPLNPGRRVFVTYSMETRKEMAERIARKRAEKGYDKLGTWLR